MSMPAAAKASRTAAGSPPGITGPFQPCGSPRKNWAASAPRAIASSSGWSTWKWAPIRTMLPKPSNRGLVPGARFRWSGNEAALGHADGQPDEAGDDAGDDHHALLAG